MYPGKFENLIAVFRRLPGVGAKTAERYAFEALGWSEEQRQEFEQAVHQIPDIRRCRICGNLSDGEICSYCSDDHRNQKIICVVQTPKDINAIESAGIYDGVYHVLNGTINTQKGIMPEDLNIRTLVNRVSENPEEIILALDPTVDGDTTALYLTRLLQDKCKITRLANGIPMGGHLDYSDSRTLQCALTGRISAREDS